MFDERNEAAVPRQITAFSNPLVKQARGLRDKKNRRAEGLFLAEGLRILTEAREAGMLPERLFFSDCLAPAARGADRGDRGAPAARRSRPVRTSSTRSAARTIRRRCSASTGSSTPASTRIDRAAAPLWIVAQALRDPGNLGTILRTGDAVGAGGLILIDDCADPFSVEAVRASMGALFTQRIAAARWETFIAWLRAGPGQLVGASLNADDRLSGRPLPKPDLPARRQRIAGAAAAYEAACDLLVKIPMLGKADSLNAAVAAAVMAYEVINQRRQG